MAERTETVTRERITELREMLETTAPITWAHEAVPELLAEIERLREQNTGLGVVVQEGWAEMERLRELCGKHDPTGADHMAEMWEHAQRADAAEAVIRRLRGGWEPDIPCLGPEVWCWFHPDNDDPEPLTEAERAVVEATKQEGGTDG